MLTDETWNIDSFPLKHAGNIGQEDNMTVLHTLASFTYFSVSSNIGAGGKSNI